MITGSRIALLEDAEDQAEMIRSWLTEAGYEVDVFGRGTDFLSHVRDHAYDILMLDWELPDTTGIDVLHWIRVTRLWLTPVVVLTHRHGGDDAASALRAGANDFIRKPADRHELLARLSAVLRTRDAPRPMQVIEVGCFRLDKARSVVSRAGVEISLTMLQFQLAWLLFEEIDKPVSRDRIIAVIWGRPNAESRTLDAHVSGLRSKLGLGPAHGILLSAIYGYGYRLRRTDDGTGALPGC